MTQRFATSSLRSAVCLLLGLCFSLDLLADDDFLDSLDQVAPESNERPRDVTLTLPDSLQSYVQDSSASTTDSTIDLDHLSKMIRWVVLKNLPPSYEDNRQWGKQKEVYDGFRFRREGLKVETYRKYKTMKHGTWKRYYLEFVDPEANLRLDISQLRNISENRFAFHVVIESPLHVFGRVSQWQRNVQLISISTNADVSVRVDVDTEVEVKINPLLFPPEATFSPQVTKASLRITQMEVQRISYIGGTLAEELGKGMRSFVDDQLVKYDEKLIDKMNKQLEKQKDKLRISSRGIFSWP